MSARIRQHADSVHLEINGRLIELPWEAAIDIGRGLISKGRLAEAHAKAAGIIYDSAILLRAGAPFTLAPTPRHLHEAKQEAAWNAKLRRYMPWGIRSTEAVGVPTILQSARNQT